MQAFEEFMHSLTLAAAAGGDICLLFRPMCKARPRRWPTRSWHSRPRTTDARYQSIIQSIPSSTEASQHSIPFPTEAPSSPKACIGCGLTHPLALQVVVKVLQSGVGDVTQSDVALASVSRAKIIGFNVAADMPVRGRQADAI